MDRMGRSSVVTQWGGRWASGVSDDATKTPQGAVGREAAATTILAARDAKHAAEEESGEGGRNRTRSDTVLETVALPVSYTPELVLTSRVRT